MPSRTAAPGVAWCGARKHDFGRAKLIASRFGQKKKENGPANRKTGGAIPVSAFLIVMMLDDDRPVMVVPAVMPAMVPMMMTVLDHDGFGVGNRRRGDRDRGERGDDVSKFPHGILLH